MASASSSRLIALDSGTSKGEDCHSDAELHSEEDQSDKDNNDFDDLEQILMRSDNDSDDDEDDVLEIMGDKKKANWSPSKKLFSWYEKVSDLELSKDILDSLKEEFLANEEIQAHFEPPRFPQPLWNTVQSSQSDLLKLKTLYKSQENLFLAIKPLLTVAESCPKEMRPNILKSIQLICSSNLSLNRFRRLTLAPHLKPELRKQLLSLPIKHNSLFGEDFGKVTDSLIKDNSTIEKIINKKKTFKANNKSRFSSNSKPYENDRNQFFQGKSRNSFRGRGRGKRNFSNKNNPNQFNPYNPSNGSN